ncbi:MAG: hypothetical protein MJY82_04995 [Fibrobacter sp.]|nr:hypothetical protein [Fibrobacter sp.]
MNLKFIAFAVAAVSTLASTAFAEDAIRFVPDPYPIGYADQGDVKHIVIKGANVSNKEIVLENVIGQGIGMSNFKFPTKIAPNAAVTVEFDMDFAGMDGQINPVVVMVATDGKPYTATLDGFVKAPIFFGEKLFDAGYYKAGEKREWTFYVWETDKKNRPDLSLSDEAAKEFSIKTKNVMVKVDENGKVTEGGKIPAQKITLSTKGLTRSGWELKQKSIRKIVGFKSKKHPKATPEVLVIGYWKE